MSKLIESYAEYFERQTEESVDLLFDSLLNYDFREYRDDAEKVAGMSRSFRCDHDPVLLYTNGSSSGRRTPYGFRPQFFRWASRIEPFLRNIHSGRNIFLCCRIGTGVPPRKLLISEVTNNKKHYDASGNFLDDNQIEELFRFTGSVYEKFGEVNFSAFPDVWNMLFSNPLFNHLCEENREKIGCLVNSDFEMFFTNRNLYVRDQMINWKSGVNFFTCRFGHKHFLPIFHMLGGCLNLTNLAGQYDDSDKVRLQEERVLCECGRIRVPMEVLFHQRHTPLNPDGSPIDFTPLRDSLGGRYASFQIHQDENDKITAFITPLKGSIDEETEVIRSFFSGMELSIEVNKYFEVGSKRYCFWRSNQVQVQEFRLT